MHISREVFCFTFISFKNKGKPKPFSWNSNHNKYNNEIIRQKN